MSNKNPMKFLPPDDPTAVYPIRAAESEPQPLEPDELDEANAPPVDDDDPLPKTFEFADDTTAPKATPLPSARPAADSGGLNPLLLVAFLGGGIVLASVVLLALAVVLYFLQ